MVEASRLFGRTIRARGGRTSTEGPGQGDTGASRLAATTITLDATTRRHIPARPQRSDANRLPQTRLVVGRELDACRRLQAQAQLPRMYELLGPEVAEQSQMENRDGSHSRH